MSSPVSSRVPSNPIPTVHGTHSIPTTPRMGSSPTPNLSSPDTPRQPDTPYAHLQTPATTGIGIGLGVTSGPVLSGRKDSMDSMRSDEPARRDEIKSGRTLDFSDLSRPSHSNVIANSKHPSNPSNHTRQPLGSAMDDKGEGPSKKIINQGPQSHVLSDTDDEEGDIELEMPEDAELRRMRKRLDEMDLEKSVIGNGWAQRDELAEMVKSLLTPMTRQLPFMREQISTQQSTIMALQEQAKVTKTLTNIEQDQHTAERAKWQAETRALLRQRQAEVIDGTRPRKMLDLDVGYHQELEAANKRLEMENRLMAPRLADAHRQIDSLVNELRHLRSHVIVETKPLTEHPAVPSTPGDPPHDSQPSAAGPSSGTIHRRRSSFPRDPRSSLGDARAEHLLLAAKKVRSMRAQDPRVGHLTLSELQRHGVVGPDGGVGYAEGYEDDIVKREESDDEDDINVFEADRRTSSASKGKGKQRSASGPTTIESNTVGTPLLPRAKKTSKRTFPPPSTPSRARTIPQAPQTTPGGNFNDLLRAAEMATDRPGSPPRTVGGVGIRLPPTATMSATRSTSFSIPSILRGDSESPSKKPRRNAPATVEWAVSRDRGESRGLAGLDTIGERMRSITGSPQASPTERNSSPQMGTEHETSALDILAQASQLDQVQTASQVSAQPRAGGPGTAGAVLTSAARFGGMMGDGLGGAQIGAGEVGAVGTAGATNSASPKSSAGESALGPAIDLGSFGRNGVAKSMTGRPKTPEPRGQDDHTNPTSSTQNNDDLATPGAQFHPHHPHTSTPAGGSVPDVFGSQLADHVFATPRDNGFHGDEYDGVARGVSESPLGSTGRKVVAGGGSGGRGGVGGVETTPGAFQSPTGAAVPGLGRYAHLSTDGQNKRQRSPYVKWSLEEDELLTRAVAVHGEKWDLVSKCVPTRSYHQVRQRWLRKTGAFDKKTTTPGTGGEGGEGGGGGGGGTSTGMGTGMGVEESPLEGGGRKLLFVNESSPTPEPKTGRKRKA